MLGVYTDRFIVVLNRQIVMSFGGVRKAPIGVGLSMPRIQADYLVVVPHSLVVIAATPIRVAGAYNAPM